MSSRRLDHAEIVTFITSTSHTVEVMRTWYRAQEFARHSHPYFTVGVMQGGIGTLWSAGVTHTLERGDVVMIPPGEVHTGGLDERGGVLSYLALHVPAELIAGAGESGGATRVLRDDRLARELADVNAAVERADAATAEAGVVAVVDRLLHKPRGDDHPASPRKPEPRLVQIARSVIDDCYADGTRTSLSALASAANVSMFHLVREFKRALGLSPHQYVIQARIRRAAELLATGIPISDAAASVGFADQAHLTAHFRRHLGTTPASWQRGHRGFQSARLARR
jgi:AraC-like DNA-binding protein